MNRAVIYCRVSTEEEKQINALEKQIDEARNAVISNYAGYTRCKPDQRQCRTGCGQYPDQRRQHHNDRSGCQRISGCQQ